MKLLDSAKYVNHVNEVIEFGKDGLFLNYSTLRDFSWEYSTNYNRITNFKRGISTKSLPIVACASNEAKDRLFEVAEKDVLYNTPGKLYVGDYYLSCYIVESKKANYLIDSKYAFITLGIVTDTSSWIKETTKAFLMDSDSGEGDLYPYDYPYDYATSVAAAFLLNSNFIDTDFRMTVYGPCTNPVIYIGSNTYQVNVTLSAGDYITIDSLNKTIVKIANDGTKTNVFNNRNKTYPIFKKIEPGSSTVSWNGLFGFDVALIEERSEPKWI